MTVGDLIKVCSEDDCVCVYDIATDTYLYDSYLCNNSTQLKLLTWTICLMAVLILLR